MNSRIVVVGTGYDAVHFSQQLLNSNYKVKNRLINLKKEIFFKIIFAKRFRPILLTISKSLYIFLRLITFFYINFVILYLQSDRAPVVKYFFYFNCKRRSMLP